MKTKRFTTLILFLLLASFGAAAQQRTLEPSVKRLQQHVRYLASDALEGRRTGTPGATKAAHYIANEFSRLRLKSLNPNGAGFLQKFPYRVGTPHGDSDSNLVSSETPAYNVIGMLEGSDPILKNEVIVIGAHYDHLGRGGAGSGSLTPHSGDIHYGADDNASGTAGVLELARIFTLELPRPRRTIVFMAFGGEEDGLLGSNYYVNNPLLPLANTIAMINMDMIGRMKDRRLVIGGVGTAQEWRDLVVDPAKYFELTLNEDGFGPSDHSSFYKKQIPVLFFWTGTHNDYHKPSDTFEKLNYADEARILAMVARIVRNIDSAEKRLTYTTAKSEPPRTAVFRVYLGTIPNYADNDDGLLIDGVRDESPAAKAGLRAGDKIVKIGSRDIKNVYDYTQALGEMKAGEVYQVEVLRGEEKIWLQIIPEARK